MSNETNTTDDDCEICEHYKNVEIIPGSVLTGKDAMAHGRKVLAQGTGLTEQEIELFFAYKNGQDLTELIEDIGIARIVEERIKLGPATPLNLAEIAEKLGLDPKDYS